METKLLSFSVENMVTIWLMVAIGFLGVGLATQLFYKWQGNSAGANNAGGY